MTGAFLTGLAIGVFIGATLGVLIMGLVVAARAADDLRESMDNRETWGMWAWALIWTATMIALLTMAGR